MSVEHWMNDSDKEKIEVLGENRSTTACNVSLHYCSRRKSLSPKGRLPIG